MTIKNSIYAPQTDANAVNDGATFYRYNTKHAGTITLTNCYYTQTLGTAQGKQALSIGFPVDVDITVVPTGNATEYGASDIIGYEGNATMDDTNGYVLTMVSTNVVFGFAMTGPALYYIEGNGTSASPYIISNAGVWEYIVSLVNYGQKYVSGKDEEDKDIYSEYATAYYKLTDDIEVTTMMGSESHRFKGHFDGNEHTLTFNYHSNEQYTAPFRYIENAEISNLRIDGNITTGRLFAVGFVANAKGNNTITNCRGAIEPDNWLVSPQLTLDGTMKVWLKGQDGDDYREHFAIYLSTTGGSKSDFLDGSGNLQNGVVTLVSETETTNKYQE